MTYVKYFPQTRVRQTAAKNNTFNPPVDIVESAEDYQIDFDLPGFTKEDVTVTVKEGVLEVAGERKNDREYDEKLYHYFERRTGSFNRTFKLPEFADGEAVGAGFENGVLTVTIPKKEAAKPYTVKIK